MKTRNRSSSPHASEKIIGLVKQNRNPIAENRDQPIQVPSETQIPSQPQLSYPILKGERKSQLTRLAWSMRQQGMSGQAIEAALLKENSIRCNPPLKEEEITKIGTSIFRYNHGQTSPFHLTDLGNAERFIDRFGDDLRFCSEEKKWHIWTGNKWQKDTANQTVNLAKKTIREMYAEIKLISNPETRKRLYAHAMKSESAMSINNMIELAKSESGVVCSRHDFDKDGFQLNTLNGTINLKTGSFEPSQRSHFITKNIPVTYDSHAQCPKFIAFLESLMNNNSNLVEYIQKIIGYSLTGDTSEQCYFFLYGTGSNGKSTLLNVVRTLLGGFAKNVDFNTLSYSGFNARNDLARLIGARFVTSVEVDIKKSLNEAVVNRITGCDPLTVKFLYGDHFEFIPKFKLFIAGNNRPNIEGTSHATWRRIRLIPFGVRFEEGNNMKKNLYNELIQELPGILNWAIEGCLKWLRDGLEPPPEVKAATTSYRQQSDTVSNFLNELCRIYPSSSVNSSKFYKTYKEWCHNNAEYSIGKQHFTEAMKAKGFRKMKRQGAEQWVGLELQMLINPISGQTLNLPPSP
jgi:putative DNA primase/helicase